MQIKKTKLAGLYLIEPQVYADKRGFFYESYRKDLLLKQGIDSEFVQDNHSKSIKGVLRGLHYQINPRAQDKLVRVLVGEIFDVAVDIRKKSATFGQWVGELLSAENKKQLFIPKGFAHGFSVLSDVVEVEYKCTDYYSPEHERGIIWNDPKFNISWPHNNPILSDRDNKWPLLKDQKDLF